MQSCRPIPIRLDMQLQSLSNAATDGKGVPLKARDVWHLHENLQPEQYIRAEPTNKEKAYGLTY